MEKLAEVFVGVDISKKNLDVYMYPLKKSFRIKNCKQGIASLLRRFKNENICKIVCESSGGYEYKMLQALAKSGHNAFRVDPKRVKHFIASEGVKTKTDSIDAKMIALFAAKMTSNYEYVLVTAGEAKLKEFVQEKIYLKQSVASEKTRTQAPMSEYSIKLINKRIVFMEKQIEGLTETINEMVEQNFSWKKKSAILESVPGVGKATAAVLIAELPELGHVNGKQIASLIGLAPYTKQSGDYKGASVISGGRSIPRSAMYMPALSAFQHNKKLKSFYNKLIEKGKKAKVAIIAVMRKLIVIMNAMLRDEQPWKVEII